MDMYLVEVGARNDDGYFGYITAVCSSYAKANQIALDTVVHSQANKDIEDVVISKFKLDTREYGTDMKKWSRRDRHNLLKLVTEIVNGNRVFYNGYGNEVPEPECTH